MSLIRKAVWSVRASVKNSGYPKEPKDFVASPDRDKALAAYRELFPKHTIWTFDFVTYVK